MSFASKALSKLSRATRSFAASTLSDPVAILNYHRINLPTSPANNLTVSEDSFRAHMRILRERFEPVPVSEMHAGRKRGECERIQIRKG